MCIFSITINYCWDIASRESGSQRDSFRNRAYISFHFAHFFSSFLSVLFIYPIGCAFQMCSFKLQRQVQLQLPLSLKATRANRVVAKGQRAWWLVTSTDDGNRCLRWPIACKAIRLMLPMAPSPFAKCEMAKITNQSRVNRPNWGTRTRSHDTPISYCNLLVHEKIVSK